jgi:DNA-binding XRE family transcriptional regulator
MQMSNNVVAVVPLNGHDFVVWFEGGLSKRYDIRTIDEGSEPIKSVTVMADGSGVTWNDNGGMTINELLASGTEVDYVSDEKYRLLRSLSSIRRNASFSQTRLGEAAGIRQSVISRIEGCEISPQINTLLKLLAPLGKTLAIVDLEDKEH